MLNQLDDGVEVVGLLRKGDYYERGNPKRSANWLWVSVPQANALLKNPDKLVWISDQIICLKDIAVARRFTKAELDRYSLALPQYALDRLAKDKQNQLNEGNIAGFLDGEG